MAPRAGAGARRPVDRASGELRRALEASEDERRSASQILSAMTEGVLLFGADGSMVFANSAANATWGPTRRRWTPCCPTG